MLQRRAGERWIQELYPSLLVLDDLTELRTSKETSSNPTAGKEHAAVRELSRRSQRVVGLYATPIENSFTELWAILDAIGTPNLWSWEDYRDFGTWDEAYVSPKTGRYVPAQLQGFDQSRASEIRSYVDEHVLRRTSAEAGVVLPSRVGPTLAWVQPTPEQAAALHAAEFIEHPLARYNQIKSILAEVDKSSAKADAAVGWILDNPGEPKIVVYAYHLSHLDVMDQALTLKGIGYVRLDGSSQPARRQELIDQFRDDSDIRVLLASNVIGVGLDLEFATALLTLTTSENPAKEGQREGRLRRFNSPNATYRHVTFVIDHPHERDNLARLRRKHGEAELVLGPQTWEPGPDWPLSEDAEPVAMSVPVAAREVVFPLWTPDGWVYNYADCDPADLFFADY
jgi:SNF2 family DNA or RNA helicase